MTETFLNQILAGGESAIVEFKSTADNLPAIGQSVCAFLNATGGTLVVGVDDRGRPLGIPNPDAAANRIQTFLFEHVSPRAPVSVSVEVVHGQSLLLVDIPSGPERPHVFADQIFVRDDSRSRHAKPQEIITLIKQRAARPISWERHAAPGAELSDLDENLILETATMAARRGLKLNNPNDPMEILRQLSLAGAGYILNSAIVLFGKAPHQRFPQTRVRAVVFEKDKTNDFRDRRDFEGNFFSLLDAVEAFVKTHVPVAAKFVPGQMRRDDQPAYPFNALREGILNALMHRDYASFTGGVAVNIYPNRLELWNSGNLPQGLSIADLRKEHPSLPHNPDIAQVVYLRGLIEKVGRGTEKIIKECRVAGLLKPIWKQSATGITLAFLRHGAARAGAELPLNERQLSLLESLKPGDRITPAAYSNQVAASVKRRQAQSDLVQLVQAGFLKRFGSTTAVVYIRSEKPSP